MKKQRIVTMTLQFDFRFSGNEKSIVFNNKVANVGNVGKFTGIEACGLKPYLEMSSH